ncbi:MAG: histone deacetylase, partial [Syntrophales bacterium]|nr:histone deacetylase [Syntrophales bacterium]
MDYNTGIVTDNRYIKHETGYFHPESPQRLEAIYGMLEDSDMRDRFYKVEVRPAEISEIAMVHKQNYIERVAATAGISSTSLDPDTVTSADSYEAALLAAGGLMNAVDRVMDGTVKNAFAFVRPPGHHAEAGRSGGFCLFNNVAIAAEHARKKHGLKRILIADWDLHHGNGTQHSFYADPGILFFSTHQYPFYPGTGSLNEIGSGAGEGYTINVPLSRGKDDADYLRIYRRILDPVSDAFKPELVLLSAGFDICVGDTLGGMKVSEQGFVNLIRCLMNIADRCCGGRLVATLGG